MTDPEKLPLSVTIAGISDLLAQNDKQIYKRVLALMERALFAEVLLRFNGNKTKTAAALGMSRFTLRSKMAELGMALGFVVADNESQAQSDDDESDWG